VSLENYLGTKEKAPIHKKLLRSSFCYIKVMLPKHLALVVSQAVLDDTQQGRVNNIKNYILLCLNLEISYTLKSQSDQF